MSNLHKLPWNQAAIATENGWVSLEGKLLLQFTNLLSQRVFKNLADAEEITRWANLKIGEIRNRREQVQKAFDTNTARKKDIEARFKKDNAELLKQSERNINAKILYLTKEIDYLKVIAEYEKAFAQNEAELVRLQEKEDKVRSRLNVLSTIVPEKKSEQKEVKSKPIEQVTMPEKQVLTRAQKGAATRRANRQAAKEQAEKLGAQPEKKLQYPGEQSEPLPEA